MFDIESSIQFPRQLEEEKAALEKEVSDLKITCQMVEKRAQEQFEKDKDETDRKPSEFFVATYTHDEAHGKVDVGALLM